MKITITTSPKNVECANCILGQAIKILMENEKARDSLGLSITDVKNALTFKKSVLKAFLSPNHTGQKKEE